MNPQRATKRVADSIVTMTELVLPHHANQLGNLLGGQLMHWIDICAALSAARHANRVCVTASVDSIDFRHPIRLGDMVTLRARLNRAFTTSMEIGVEVTAENIRAGTGRITNTAFLTFVSLDEEGLPSPVPVLVPETEAEKSRFDDALRRRQVRLETRRSQ